MAVLISHGKGFIGFVAPFASALITEGSVGTPYWESHRWPFAAALLVAGVVTASFGIELNRNRSTKAYLDLETGQRVESISPVRHTTFWMPMEWWGGVFSLIGVASFFFDVTKL